MPDYTESEYREVLSLTNSQRRCIHSVGKFGFWDTQSTRHRRECIDLGLMKWADGAKLTPKGARAYQLLRSLARTTGTYLNESKTGS